MDQAFLRCTRFVRTLIVLILASGISTPASALPRTWIGGNVDWVDEGNPANWNPADEPDPDDEAIFNTADTVNLGSSNTIQILSLSAGSNLFTNGHQLAVSNQSTIDGVGTTLHVDPHATPGTIAFQTLDLDLNNGGTLVMNGGIVSVGAQLEINANSVLSGYGTINLGDLDAIAEQAFDNSSLIQVASSTLAPQTLTLHTNGLDMIDLDGDLEVGVVNVANAVADINADTLTLIIDGPLADPFGGILGATLKIGQRDTLTFNQDFQLTNNARVEMDGGNSVATLNGAGNITSIIGVRFITAGHARIVNDMSFNGTSNIFTTAEASTLTLAGTVAVSDASMFLFGANSHFVVSGATTVNEPSGDFDWDGNGTVATTIQGNGLLTLNVDQIEPASSNFQGTIHLDDNGSLAVNVTAASWNMNGKLHKNNAGTSTISGDAMQVAGQLHVSSGTLVLPAATFLSASTVAVDGLLALDGTSVLAENVVIGGSGTLLVPSGRELAAGDNADIHPLLDIQGTFQPGAAGGTGRVNLSDYHQADTGELRIDLTGTGLGEFDQLVASGDVVLDGGLRLSIGGGFVPALGNAFQIITSSSVAGEFDHVDVAGMPPGLAFAVAYLESAVELQVVNTPFFSADFDHDGDVDVTDYSIWKANFHLNQLGDANGDGITSAADYTAWRNQFGSGPMPFGSGGGGIALENLAVPEPATAALLTLAAIFVGGLRRRR